MKGFICKDCDKEFILTNDEIQWYDKKGFPHPKRCKACRAKKRAQEQIEGKK